MEYALEVKKLTKKYEGFALKDVSFKLPKGMIMGFIGENGAGKTTTIKAILNIIKNYEGEIKILGFDNNNQAIKEEIGVVLDDMFFPEILKIKDIDKIMKGIYHNWDSAIFNKYLTDFNLPATKSIKTLSKGMLKKLQIITALSHHPKLLILDEPTTGLDPIARTEIMKIFQDFIQNEECSIFFSSHITTDLEHIADYITFILDGKIILSETSDDIFNNYAIGRCSEKEFLTISSQDYVKYIKNKYGYELLIPNKKEFLTKYHLKVIDKITLEDLMILMAKGEN